MDFIILWIVAFVVLCLIEAFTTNLVTIWFALGSLAAFFAAVFGLAFHYQFIIFVVVSTVLLLLTRPLAKKFMQRKNEPTNADMAIDKTAIVIEDIDPITATGQVKVAGQIWSAKSLGEVKIAKDSIVKVVDIKGVKLIVKEEN